MKRNSAGTAIAFILSATLAIPTLLMAQEQQPAQCEHKHHTRYRVVDTGSFGGPNSHMSLGAHILNNDGTFTGYADIPVSDPYANNPDDCWDGDCIVAHTFRWKNAELTDLGALYSGPSSTSNWMSANGLIAGESQNGSLDPFTGHWEIRAVLWKRDKIIDVGTLDGGYESTAKAVNSAGEVVGLSTTTTPDPDSMIMTSIGLPFPFQTRAFRWMDGVIQDLGTLGGPDAIALGINERGQIIGNSYTSLDPSPACGSLATGAFLWEKGQMANLGSLGGTCTGVSAINDHGQVTGFSYLAGDEVFHPFLWERGKLRDLETSADTVGSAGNLNEAGDVVGWETIPGNANIIHATLWSRGRTTDLGALGTEACSLPFAINSKKQVVVFRRKIAISTTRRNCVRSCGNRRADDRFEYAHFAESGRTIGKCRGDQRPRRNGCVPGLP